MRGYEKGHVRQGKRPERKDGITEIRGKAIPAADHVKRIALSGSRTLSERCRGNEWAKARRHTGLQSATKDISMKLGSFLRMSVRNCEEGKKVS